MEGQERNASGAVLPERIVKALDHFDEALTRIETEATPFLKEPMKNVVPRLTPTENAKLNMVYSYALNSLFYMLLKTQGVSPKEHPVKKELERIQSYMSKTIKASEEAAARAKAEDHETTPQDVDASKKRKMPNGQSGSRLDGTKKRRN